MIFFDFVSKKKKRNALTKLTFLHEFILSGMWANFRWYMYEISSILHNCDFLCFCFKKYSEKSSCFHITVIFFDFVSKIILQKLKIMFPCRLCFYLILCTNYRPLVEVLVRITQIQKKIELDHVVYKFTE